MVRIHRFLAPRGSRYDERMRWCRLASSIACAGLIGAYSPAAFAQVPSAPVAVPGPPPVRWFDPFHLGDALGSPGDDRSMSTALFEPLRLSLLGPYVPGPSLSGPCADSLPSAGAVTAATPGYTPQYASALRLVPRLTLYGFSRAGCALDAAVGGGAVYAAPIVEKKLYLVGSAGYVFLPAPAGARRTASSAANVDAVLLRPDGKSVRLGVGTRGVTVGGTF
jgi:hypothetical protein